MLGQTSDPILQKVEQAVQAHVAQPDQAAFQKVLALGMNIMHSPQSHQYMVAELSKPGDPAEKVGEGVAKLIAVMLHKSKGTMPMKAAMPAAQVLVCEALDFMAQSKKVTITNDLVAASCKAFATYFLQALKVTPQKMQSMMENASQQVNAKQPKGIIGQAQAVT